MQLNVAIGGGISAAAGISRSAHISAQAATLPAPIEPVPDVTVALSPIAGATLDGQDPARDGGRDPGRETGGNVLSPPGLLSALHPSAKDEQPSEKPPAAPSDPNQLSDAEKAVVEELRKRDAEVRAHEMAHVAAAGGLAGAPTFSYQTGPDGKRYAVGGSVTIDTSGGASPEETINKAQRIRSAALAPAEPSGQDRAVAAKATQMEVHARAHLAAERREEERQRQVDAEQRMQRATTVDPTQPGATTPPAAADSGVSLPPFDTTAAPIPQGISVMATPEERVRLAFFEAGTAGEAQLFTPPERAIEQRYLEASRSWVA